VFALAAVVAELLTLSAVAIVSSLVSTIAALALMSALTMTPEAIEVALPTLVTSPVRLALMVTAPAVKPAAVPVQFVRTPAEGVPRLGVTRTRELANFELLTPASFTIIAPPESCVVLPSTAPDANVAEFVAALRVAAVTWSAVVKELPVIKTAMML
jgi:hypothetical protein